MFEYFSLALPANKTRNNFFIVFYFSFFGFFGE